MTFVDSSTVAFTGGSAGWNQAPSGASSSSGPASGIAPWMHEVEARLRELFLLNEGWDGGFAPRVVPATIQRAHELLAQVATILPGSRRPTVAPTPNGGVALEWNSSVAHLEIVAEGTTVVVGYDVPQAGLDWEGLFSEAPLNAGQLLYEYFS